MKGKDIHIGMEVAVGVRKESTGYIGDGERAVIVALPGEWRKFGSWSWTDFRHTPNGSGRKNTVAIARKDYFDDGWRRDVVSLRSVYGTWEQYKADQKAYEEKTDKEADEREKREEQLSQQADQLEEQIQKITNLNSKVSTVWSRLEGSWRSYCQSGVVQIDIESLKLLIEKASK